MPKLTKQFYLEITVEQFLRSCSLTELQELDLLLASHLRRAEEKDLRNQYRKGKKSLEEMTVHTVQFPPEYYDPI